MTAAETSPQTIDTKCTRAEENAKTANEGTIMSYEFGECINPDHDLIRRAGELIRDTHHLMGGALTNGFDWLGIVTFAIDRAYAGLPQAWVAWGKQDDHIGGKEPDETAVFQPKDLAKRDRWLQHCLSNRYEIVTFQAPLEDENPAGTRHLPAIVLPSA